MTCTAVGCDSPVLARGGCHAHYAAWYRAGTLDEHPRVRLPSGGECAVEDCTKAAYGRGWCRGHHARWYQHGDVDSARPLGRPEPGHGTDSRYSYRKCRCEPCTAAHRAYQADYRARQQAA